MQNSASICPAGEETSCWIGRGCVHPSCFIPNITWIMDWMDIWIGGVIICFIYGVIPPHSYKPEGGYTKVHLVLCGVSLTQVIGDPVQFKYIDSGRSLAWTILGISNCGNDETQTWTTEIRVYKSGHLAGFDGRRLMKVDVIPFLNKIFSFTFALHIYFSSK